MRSMIRTTAVLLVGLALVPLASGKAADYRRNEKQPKSKKAASSAATAKSTKSTADEGSAVQRAGGTAAAESTSKNVKASAESPRKLNKSQMTAAKRTSYKQDPPPPAPIVDSGTHDGAIVGDGCSDGSCGNGSCAGGDCGDGCCSLDGCGDCFGCDPCGYPDVITAGFEFTFLKPYWESNSAFIAQESNGLAFHQTDRQFGYQHQLAPRAWLAYACNNGLGIRTGYWQYDNDSARETGLADNNTTLAGPFIAPDSGFLTPQTINDDDTYSAISSLEARTLDLEGTKRGDFCLWALTGSAGVRYAKIKQTYDGEVRDDTDTLTSAVVYNHGFEGVGPTFGLQAVRPLGCRLSLFSAARGSILIGNGQSNLFVREGINTTVPQPTSVLSKRNDLLSIGEIQVGGEYNSLARLGRGQMFVRGTVEGQVWQGVGSASSEDGDLVFFGGTVAVGLKF